PEPHRLARNSRSNLTVQRARGADTRRFTTARTDRQFCRYAATQSSSRRSGCSGSSGDPGILRWASGSRHTRKDERGVIYLTFGLVSSVSRHIPPGDDPPPIRTARRPTEGGRLSPWIGVSRLSANRLLCV